MQFTRSRPYKKDDNAHVEQKNWTHVRKLVGWERYDSAEALEALNALYADLRIFQNLFQPSMKLVRKVRVGSRLIRRYAARQTPFERVRACPEVDPAKVAVLQRVLETTDPFALSRRIDQHLEHSPRGRHGPRVKRHLGGHSREARGPGAAGPSAHAYSSRSAIWAMFCARRGDTPSRTTRRSLRIRQIGKLFSRQRA